MSEPMQVDPISMDEPEIISLADEVIHTNVTMDLDGYIANYNGFMKYQRLMFIARSCSSLQLEALKLAMDYVKNYTYDVSAYQIIFKSAASAMHMSHHQPTISNPSSSLHGWFNSAFGGSMSNNGLPDAVPDSGRSNGASFLSQSGPTVLQGVTPNGQQIHFVFDHAWMENTRRKSALTLERLDTDLKNYKANSIKESIRRGSDDLGDMYVSMGDLNNALKCYSRSRDYCTSYRQELNMCLNVIRVAIFLRNWSHVNTHVSRAESMPDLRETSDNAATSYRDYQMGVKTKLLCATGLAELAVANYKMAARSFLAASYDHCDYNEVLTVSDIAHYGGLCAMATFDRSELKSKVLNSVSFKQFLEAEPEVRDIVYNFYNSQYTECLRGLNKIKDFLRMDIFLSYHVNFLYREIRSRALCQYFSPYLSADLYKMASAFTTTVNDLENELTALILDGKMNARIDSHGKVLHSRCVDQRGQTFERALSLADDYERKAKAALLRTALAKRNLCVKQFQIAKKRGASNEATE